MGAAAVSEQDTVPKRGSGGRPTREDAARREAHIVEVATRLFLERGFDATSIDAVAEAAGVSKPTLYARYRDKRALFEAILRERIEAWLAPISAVAEAQARRAGPEDAEAVLDELSRALTVKSRSPETAALTRCIAAQVMHFPEIATLAHEEGWLRGVRAVARLLEILDARGRISAPDPETAAELFLDLVRGAHSRSALYGIVSDPGTLERRRQAAVRLFLDGVRRRHD